jgi:hypothetical protein
MVSTMDDLEVIVFVASLIASLTGFLFLTPIGLHPVAFENNPWPGLVRAAQATSMAWLAFVIWRYADPSVTGIYVVFYMVMGFGVVTWTSHLFGEKLGARYRVDVCERKNPAAGFFHAALVLSIGIIFASSLWGEANPDPNSDDEGGFWIPLGFFFMGAAVLFGALYLYSRREPGGLVRALQSERDVAAGRAAAAYTLGLAWPISRAVAGDFLGWSNGIAAVAQVVVMLALHELFRLLGKGVAQRSRRAESVVYVVAGLVVPTVMSLVPGFGS